MSDLDSLLELAEQQASTILLERKFPRLIPAWVLVQPDQTVQVIGTPWADETEKQASVVQIKHRMRELGTVAYSLTAEAWQASSPRDQIDLERPRNRPDRVEVLVALAANAREQRHREWRIIRRLGQIVALEPEQRVPDLPPISWLGELLSNRELSYLRPGQGKSYDHPRPVQE